MTRSSAIDLCQRVVSGVALDAPALERGDHRADEDLDVGHGRLEVVDVFEVELDAVSPHDRVAAFELRPPGNAGANFEAPPLALVVSLHLVGQGWAGADHAHLAAQDVEKLRDLIEREPAEEAAD